MPARDSFCHRFIFRPLVVLALAGLVLASIAGCAPQEATTKEPPAPAQQEAAEQPTAAPTGGATPTTEQAPPVEGSPPAEATSPKPLAATPAKEPAAGARPSTALAALAPKPSIATSAFCYKTATGGGRRGKRGGLCEPQSLPFARCRSGVSTCRLGNTGPMTWFICEKNRGNTGDIPRQGSILILGVNGRRGMPTGHVAYVEEVIPESADTWKLILSHTNYDRRCSMETQIETRYFRRSGNIDFLTGAWKAWAKGLKVAGFILD